MGDDPFLPVGNTASHGSSNAVNYFINHLGKPSTVIMVVTIGLSLGLSVGAIVIANMNGRDAARAEREARMAEYYITRLDALLVEQGIKKAGDDFQKFKKEN